MSDKDGSDAGRATSPSRQTSRSGGSGERQPRSSSTGRSRGGRSAGSTSRTRVQIGEYLLGKTLGIGSFGKVKLAEHVLTGQLVAIKVLNRARIRSLDMEEKVRREIQILKIFVHPHIIRLYEVIETPTDIFLVMEYVAGGELFDYIVSKGRLHLDEARQFFQQIVSGVAYCHNSKVVHRDLKPENLLLSADLNVKVADFGLSNIMHDGEFLRTSCGSPNYAAPEVISGNLYAGPEVDIWSCGVILYALLCGMLPFDDESIPRLFRKIRNGHYVLPSYLDEASRDLIPRMLVVDPTQRIKIDEIRAHPFFTTRLPPYLSLPVNQQSLATETDEINEECVSEILRLQHPFVQTRGRAGVIAAINSKRKTFIQVIYHLYLDQMQARVRAAELRASKTLANEASSYPAFSPKAIGPASEPGPSRVGARPSPSRDGSSRGARQTGPATPSHLTSPYGPSSMPGQGRGRPSSVGVHHRPGAVDADGVPVSAGSASSTPGHVGSSTAAAHRHRSRAHGRKWYLGIQSKKEPELVMSEVFRALKSLRSHWHYAPSNPYRVTCRWRPSCLGVNDPNVPDEWVYVSLQLYKVQPTIYLLDFQRAGGISGCFSFMRLCSLIINALKTPASASGPSPAAALAGATQQRAAPSAKAAS